MSVFVLLVIANQSDPHKVFTSTVANCPSLVSWSPLEALMTMTKRPPANLPIGSEVRISPEEESRLNTGSSRISWVRPLLTQK